MLPVATSFRWLMRCHTASSLESTVTLKFPVAVAGAPVFRNTASGRPERSVTASTKGSLAEEAAALMIVRTSSAVSELGSVDCCCAGGSLTCCEEPLEPPPQLVPARQRASATGSTDLAVSNPIVGHFQRTNRQLQYDSEQMLYAGEPPARKAFQPAQENPAASKKHQTFWRRLLC